MDFSDRQHLLLKYVLWLVIVLTLGGVFAFALSEKNTGKAINQVSITGRGSVDYQSDVATVNLGVLIDKAPTAQEALSQLNGKIDAVIAALNGVGITSVNIQNQNYAIYPRYETVNNQAQLTGYGASQNIFVKVENILSDKEILPKVISAATGAGANQINAIEFSVANLEELKQQARIAAINDAKSKSQDLAKAAGVKLGKVVAWYENDLNAPDISQPASTTAANASTNSMPNIPDGSQKIVIEMGVNFEVK